MKKTFLILTYLMVLAVVVQAQNERKFVRQGNKYFQEAMKDTAHIDTVQFNKAEIEYRKAIEKKPAETKWDFNLADALYKQKKFEESAGKFKEIADKTFDKTEKSRALHNLGNSMLMGKKIDESIAAYKEALRNNPGDLDTKYNLQYAMNLKKKQQQQQKNQDKNKDQNKDKKDQNKKDQKNQNKDQNKNQDKDQDKKNQDQQNKNQNQNQNKDQQNQPQQSKISKQNAEQMLQALENNEKKIQDKVKKVQAMKAQSKRVDKDW